MNALIQKYNIYIYEKCNDLVKSGKLFADWDNYDISKIFEYYSAIKHMETHKRPFYEYNDIDPTFKENNCMSRNDTGIDLCDLVDTIVQCKLRNGPLTWTNAATFFASQICYDENQKKIVIRWPNLVLATNNECQLSVNLKNKKNMYVNTVYNRCDVIGYCNNLLKNPPEYPVVEKQKFVIRDYQQECINLIAEGKNTVICIPTGGGKNVIIIHSIKKGKKYLILVPRIILMDQFKEELLKHKPAFKKDIQTIGDGNNEYDETKNITICVFNSVSVVEKYCDQFDNIFVDEAHHVITPEIYTIDNDDVQDNEDDENNEDNEDNDNNDNNSDSDNNNSDDQQQEENNNEQDNDSKNETKNKRQYTNIIKSLKKYNNNIYLSATIDKIDGFSFYKKDIRDMINAGYLCDYNIVIPIFDTKPSNENICKYIIERYRNIIIYCNTQKEGLQINEMMNKLLPNCSEYIDCHTSKKDRDKIMNKYKSGELPYLVNVKVLVEGFDAPITRGVVFIHMPSSLISIIQIIGRALRLYYLKTLANIILLYSLASDGININNILKIIARNDYRIRQSYTSRKLEGYINLDLIKSETVDLTEETKDAIFRYEVIYNSLGTLLSKNEMTNYKIDVLFEYANLYKKEPAQKTQYKDMNIGNFLGGLKSRITDVNCDMYKKLSVNEHIKKSIDRFLKIRQKKESFTKYTPNECKDIFLEYCNSNESTPSYKTIHKNMPLGRWFSKQKEKIKDKESEIYLDLSTNKYAKENLDIFMSQKEAKNNVKKLNEDEWIKLLFEYYNEYNNVPPCETKYKEQNLGSWYNYRLNQIFNGNTKIYDKLCKNESIKTKIDDYIKNRQAKEEKEITWDEKKKLLFSYCSDKGKSPASEIVYESFNLGFWLHYEKQRLANLENPFKDDRYIKLCENSIIKNTLDKYLNSEKHLSFDEKKDLLFEYCDKNNRMPPENFIYKSVKIYKWFQSTKQRLPEDNPYSNEKYIKLSKHHIIKKAMDKYILERAERKTIAENTIMNIVNGDEDSELEDVKEITGRQKMFNERKQSLFEYCNKNGKLPPDKLIYNGVNLYRWLHDVKRRLPEDDPHNNIKYVELSENNIVKNALDTHLQEREKNKPAIKKNKIDDIPNDNKNNEPKKVVKKTNSKTIIVKGKPKAKPKIKSEDEDDES